MVFLNRNNCAILLYSFGTALEKISYTPILVHIYIKSVYITALMMIAARPLICWKCCPTCIISNVPDEKLERPSFVVSMLLVYCRRGRLMEWERVCLVEEEEEEEEEEVKWV